MGTVEVFKYAKPLGGAANIQDNVGTSLHKSKWKSSGHSASCNLIISADQINKYSGEEGFFAVTSAHLLLGEDVCAKLKTVDPNDPAEQRAVTLLDVERAKFYAKLDQRIHQLHLPDKTTCDLGNPPLLCYQYWQQHNQEGALYKAFINDLALLPIDFRFWDMAKRSLTCIGFESSDVGMMTDITKEILQRMAVKREPVHIEGRKVNVVPMARSLNSKTLGLHLSFKLKTG